MPAQDLAQKQLEPVGLWRIEDLIGGADFHHLTLIHKHHAVRDLAGVVLRVDLMQAMLMDAAEPFADRARESS